jgi:hypothetical protein
MVLIAIPLLGLDIARGAPDPQQHLVLMIWSSRMDASMISASNAQIRVQLCGSESVPLAIPSKWVFH